MKIVEILAETDFCSILRLLLDHMYVFSICEFSGLRIFRGQIFSDIPLNRVTDFHLKNNERNHFVLLK